jgi:hypothetical protein
MNDRWISRAALGRRALGAFVVIVRVGLRLLKSLKVDRLVVLYASAALD